MKKIISLLLALAVALTMCVIPAFADVTNADSATVVYVVDEAQDGETVEGLAAGEYFVPDRMPIAETPAGKYFAGWQDANGNWAGVDGFLLTAGENTLTAVYKDYVYNTVSTSGYVYSNEDVFAYASYDSNGENFMNYVDGNGSYLNFETVDLNGEEVLCIKNGNTWGSRANFLIPNSDGSAMVVEPGESYNITMTYKVPNYVEEIYLLFAEGLGFDNSGSFVDTRVEINTPFQGVAQSVASFTSSTDPNFNPESTGWTWIVTSGGHHQWEIVGASEDWVSTTFTVEVPYDTTGFLPLLQGAIRLPGSSELYIKEIKVKNVNAVDTNASIKYVVDGDVEDTVEGLVVGGRYVPDRMPKAEAPEGKYFAGWQDASGNWAGIEGFLLADGVNTLTAVFKDYVYDTATSYGYNFTNESVFAYASVDPNGENFMNYVDGTGSYLYFATAEVDGEQVLRIKNPVSWGARATFIIPNADGSAMVVEPGETYTITMTYMVPDYIDEIDLLFAEGLGFYKDGQLLDSRLELTTPFQGIVQRVADFTSTTDPNFSSESTGWTYLVTPNGHHQWAISGGSEEWVSVTFTIDVPEDTTGFLPVLQAAFGFSGGADIYIKEIQVKNVNAVESNTSVEYVVNGEVEDTVENLVAGEYYVPDRMPKAEAPVGKYFAGWQDASGNWAGVDGFELADGVNTLTAVFKDYVYKATSTKGYAFSNESVFAYASVDPNGENFMNYIDGTGSYLYFASYDLDGEQVLRVKNPVSWGARATFVIPNSDGTPMVVEAGETYTITMTYKVPEYVDGIDVLFAEGLGFNNNGTYVDTRVELNTAFQGIAQSVASFTSTTDPHFTTESTGWTYVVTSSGHHQWAIEGASEDWVTATFTLEVPEDTTGYLPVLQGVFALSGNAEFFIKEIVVENVEAVETPEYIVGDVDGNGEVDAADLAVLKKVIAKLTPMDDPSVVNTDVDGNGEEIPDAADLAKLKKIIAKLD